MYRADTIVACATASGRGAIAIVRCSGGDALVVADAVFRPRSPGPLEAWKLRLGTVLAADGVTPIDEALGVFFPRSHSFTGEDTFEVHCHGSPIIVEQLLASAIAAGARSAEPGEFTRRAVLNGKLDLLQAEAIADLVDAKMAAGARAAWEQLQGALSDEFAMLRAELVSVLAQIEAEVDFTDDELPGTDFSQRQAAITAIQRRVEAMLGGFAASRRRREGVRVVFTGKPNAGKSSLVNRLLGSPRMIVSDEPGTTRDVVEEAVDLGGIAFVLADTAGIREAAGPAENQAVQRARQTVGEADVCVLVLDGSEEAADSPCAVPGGVRAQDTIVVWNKMDLGTAVPAGIRDLAGAYAAVLSTSARTGAGCHGLAEALAAAARGRTSDAPAGISRLRHRAALERAVVPLRRAAELAASESHCELAAAQLRSALVELAAISIPVDNEEVLDRIFSEFCIGK